MDPMRMLVVYYSRTGTTGTVARTLRDELGCEVEQIAERKERRGVLGYLRAGFDATFHRAAELRPMSTDPKDYDLVIVGTPIWNASVSAPVRAYLAANRERIPRVAFFCTHGGSGSARVLHQMEEICGQKPVSALVLRTDEVRRGSLAPKVRIFASTLTSAPTPAKPTWGGAPLHPVPT